MEEKKLENIKGSVTGSAEVVEEDHEEDVVFPGFRFHPSDEELVAFYLRRKVERKAFSIDIIKQIDIYKYDPWDLPKGSHLGGELDKEWYFFCLRGRKYRNSIRPNRVTGSGFWKATGIDKSIYSSVTAGECIGLKKSLVYYRGSAGRGTKTDWMMHEFRLPSSPEAANTTPTIQEAEIWTICRIFKRNVTYNKKYTQRQEDTKASITGKRNHQYMHYYSACTTSINSFESDARDDRVGIINHQPFDLEHHAGLHGAAAAAAAVPEIAGTPPSASGWSELDFRDGSWDELGRIMELTYNGSKHN